MKKILAVKLNNFFENFHVLMFFLQKMDNYFSTNCKRKKTFFEPLFFKYCCFFAQSSHQVPPDCEADLCLDRRGWRGRRRDHLAVVGRLPVGGAAVASARVESVAGARPGKNTTYNSKRNNVWFDRKTAFFKKGKKILAINKHCFLKIPVSKLNEISLKSYNYLTSPCFP